MANKTIDELVEASTIGGDDLFVLKQTGGSRKLRGQTLLNWLTKAADGHGGIKSIEQVSKTGLVATYRITLADNTYTDIAISDGNGIAQWKKTGTSGLTDTYRVTMGDGSTFDYTVENGDDVESLTKLSTSGLDVTWRFTLKSGKTMDFTVTNGAKGDPGVSAYVHFKWASQQPTADSHSFGDIPDDWMGVYAGESPTAPTDWQQYAWYRTRGDKGETGEASTVVSSETVYQVSTSGTVVPSGNWVSDPPAVPQGKYLWSRTIITFNSGTPAVTYSVARNGMDGTGTVKTVNGVEADSDGNVTLTVGTDDLEDGAVTAPKIGDGVIPKGKLAFVPITTEDFAAFSGAGFHNSLYRGKNLGDHVTDEQYAAIAAGTFDDLWIGDYWEISGVTYRIAAFDYYYKTGDTLCTTHHVTIVPDETIGSSKMNDTESTIGAYAGSYMYSQGLSDVRNLIDNTFGANHILNHRQYLKNAVTDNYETAGAWYDSKVELMTECNVFGCNIYSNYRNGTAFADLQSIDNSQYPLFNLDKTRMRSTETYWLRDVASDIRFCSAENNGLASYNRAVNPKYIRPAFSIF